MKKLVLAGLVTLAVGCGGKTVYVTQDSAVEDTEVATEAPTTTAALPTETRPPASYDTNNGARNYDPDGFDYAIWDQAYDFWSLYATEDLLQMGLLVCDLFDSGATMDDVSNVIIESMSSTGTLYLMEGMAVVAGSAVVYLCPEHFNKVATA